MRFAPTNRYIGARAGDSICTHLLGIKKVSVLGQHASYVFIYICTHIHSSKLLLEMWAARLEDEPDSQQVTIVNLNSKGIVDLWGN